tara:strand:+ start:12915 stop:13964 length:1050 start_codon:yes stop_codon:yes gene_type:complete
MDEFLMKDFYKNKKILITGHSGFKGAWMSLFLNQLGSTVSGLSDMKIQSGIYREIKKNKIFTDEFTGDISNLNFINEIISKNDFDIVFHFAAQGIVSKAAENPRETITTNVLGTYNLLDACNRNENIKLFVVATTDKVYEDHSNNNIESSKLGGREFYSASKASSEHIIQAFVNTEKRGDLFIGTVRAGNVLGGGDYGKDRILTDVLNSLSKKTNITLRNPNAIRPWQYILDSIYGYLLVGEHCQIDSQNSIFNLNSELNNKYTVLNFVETLLEQWTSDYKCSIKYEEGDKFYESKILTINSSKAQNILDWCPSFDMESLCKYIAEYETSTNKYEYAISHVNSFLEKVN